MHRRFKQLAALLSLLAVVAAAAWWAAPALLSSRLQASLSRSLGCRVEWQGLSLQLRGLSASNLRLLDPRDGVTFAEARQAWLGFTWGALLRGQLQPTELRIGPGRLDLDRSRLQLFATPPGKPPSGRSYPIHLEGVALSWNGTAWADSGWSADFPAVAPGQASWTLRSARGAQLQLQRSGAQTRAHFVRCPVSLLAALSGLTLPANNAELDVDAQQTPQTLSAQGALRSPWWSGPWSLDAQNGQVQLQIDRQWTILARRSQGEWTLQAAPGTLLGKPAVATARFADLAHWSAQADWGDLHAQASCQGEVLQARADSPQLSLQMGGTLRWQPLPTLSAQLTRLSWGKLILGGGHLEASGNTVTLTLEHPVRAGELSQTPPWLANLKLRGASYSQGRLTPMLAP